MGTAQDRQLGVLPRDHECVCQAVHHAAADRICVGRICHPVGPGTHRRVVAFAEQLLGSQIPGGTQVWQAVHRL